jgi:hypothetical protein
VVAPEPRSPQPILGCRPNRRFLAVRVLRVCPRVLLVQSHSCDVRTAGLLAYGETGKTQPGLARGWTGLPRVGHRRRGSTGWKPASRRVGNLCYRSPGQEDCRAQDGILRPPASGLRMTGGETHSRGRLWYTWSPGGPGSHMAGRHSSAAAGQAPFESLRASGGLPLQKGIGSGRTPFGFLRAGKVRPYLVRVMLTDSSLSPAYRFTSTWPGW